jgi:hypothetical protein
MLFDEFQMSGYDPDRQDTNEIYVEIKAGILMQSLKIPSINAKFVKIRLINKAGPCMSIEAELVGLHFRWSGSHGSVFIRASGIFRSHLKPPAVDEQCSMFQSKSFIDYYGQIQHHRNSWSSVCVVRSILS